MFGFGSASGQMGSAEQLQRRLRLSDVGLEHSPAAQMLLEDAGIIKVVAVLAWLQNLASSPHHAGDSRLLKLQ